MKRKKKRKRKKKKEKKDQLKDNQVLSAYSSRSLTWEIIKMIVDT